MTKINRPRYYVGTNANYRREAFTFRPAWPRDPEATDGLPYRFVVGPYHCLADAEYHVAHPGLAPILSTDVHAPTCSKPAPAKRDYTRRTMLAHRAEVQA